MIVSQNSDNLSDFYESIYKDYSFNVKTQALALSKFICSRKKEIGKILDCAAGIGTQSIGLWDLSYDITSLDISNKCLKRIQQKRPIPCVRGDFRALPFSDSSFDLIIMMDNSLPYVESYEDVVKTLQEGHRVLRDDGAFLLSLRPYDELVVTKPTIWKKSELGERYHQIWKWHNDTHYTSEFYFHGNKVAEFKFRAILDREIRQAAKECSFNCERIEGKDVGWFQPMYCLYKV